MRAGSVPVALVSEGHAKLYPPDVIPADAEAPKEVVGDAEAASVSVSAGTDELP